MLHYKAFIKSKSYPDMRDIEVGLLQTSYFFYGVV